MAWVPLSLPSRIWAWCLAGACIALVGSLVLPISAVSAPSLLPTPPGGTGGTGLSAGVPAAALPPAAALAAKGLPQYSTAGTVVGTLDLFNGTVSRGNTGAISGAFPWAVAADPRTGVVYAADLGSNSVSVINGSTGRGIAIVPVSGGPDGIAVAPANDRVFVTENYSNSVAVLDGASGRLVATVPVGSTPEAVAFDSVDGDVYVVNAGSNNSTVLNATTDAFVGTVAAGPEPDAVAVDPQNGFVYVGDRGSGFVTVINGSNDSVYGTIRLAANVTGVAVDPETGMLFASEGPIAKVAMIALSNDSLVGSIAVGAAPQGIAVDPTSGLVFVANYAWFTVSVLNGSLREVVQTVHGLEGPWGVGYDAANGDIFVTNIYQSNLTVMNGSTGRSVASAPVGSPVSDVAVNTLNGDLYVASDIFVGYAGETAIVNGTTDAIVGELPTGALAMLFDRATDTLYVANGIESVLVYNGTSDTRLATLDLGPDSNPSALALGSNGDLFVADSGTGTVSVISTATNSIVGSNVLGDQAYPDGIAVDNATGRVYVADGGGSNVTELDEAAPFANLSTIPVGQAPYAIALDAANGDLYVANSNSNTVSVISGATDRVIATIPVGSYPVALSVDRGNGFVYVADGDANAVTVIHGKRVLGPGPIAVGEYPSTVAYDPLNGHVLVGNTESGTLSTVAKVFSVTFHATGLPTGSSWSVTSALSDGTNTTSARGGTIVLLELPGEATFSVGAPPGYGVSRLTSARLTAFGALQVAGPTAVGVRFGPLESLYFNETGLPAGSNWSVTLTSPYGHGGVPGNFTSSTTGTSIRFTVVAGAWKYTISVSGPYAAHPAHGTARVPHRAAEVRVRFRT